MQRLFAVIRTRGPAWQDAQPLEGQADWTSHGSFMNRSRNILLIVRAGSPDEIRSRLAEDPWAHNDLPAVTRVAPWTLRLGSLDDGSVSRARI